MSAQHFRALVVAGARPNFIKVAPIVGLLEQRGHETLLVHTGQHYSPEMSSAIFNDLGMRAPDVNLESGSGSHAQQTARVMEAFEPVLLRARPDWLIVVGDVNSTLACALVAAKLRAEAGCRIAHVEAGLRSNDWRMPEEVNRVLTDRLSDALLTPSCDAHDNLRSEGIAEDRVRFVGNVMIDTLYAQLDRARALNAPRQHGVQRGEYALVTLHRPSNVDSPASLREIITGLARLAKEMPVVFAVHPRTRRRIEEFELSAQLEGTIVTPPLSYLEMLSLQESAAVVLTDSGGVQEETTVLGVPCVTLREQTERPATVLFGTNRLVPWPLTSASIVQSTREARDSGRVPIGSRCPEGWDGQAACRIVDFLASRPPLSS
jgi:UDP-N-acetylglucosamine 2-epimerase (non-hydrolysing)